MAVLFLVDIENLCGGKLNFRKVTLIKRKLFLIAGDQEYLMVFGCDPSQQKLVTRVFPKEVDGKVVMEGYARKGKDGADQAIRYWLEQNQHRLKDFRAVVLASGDHFFFEELRKFKKLGKKLMVVHGEGGVHHLIQDLLPRRIYGLDDARARDFMREKPKKSDGKRLKTNTSHQDKAHPPETRTAPQVENISRRKSAPWRAAGGTATLVGEQRTFKLVLCSARETMAWLDDETLQAPWNGPLAQAVDETDAGLVATVITPDGQEKALVLKKQAFRY